MALTTNGILFAELAQELKQAGLRRVNFSLDTLNAAVFKELTGTDEAQHVLHAISAALELGFGPVKINTVVLRGINEQEVMELAYLAKPCLFMCALLSACLWGIWNFTGKNALCLCCRK